MQQSCFYEIEMKALISEEVYNHLRSELPRNHELLTEETTITTRYRPHDVRLRSSSTGKYEIIIKEGDPTSLCRQETIAYLKSEEDLEKLKASFPLIGFKPDPPWTKDKLEVRYNLNGYFYVVCVQHIKNFAYLLEVEHISKKDDSEIHRPNLERIIRDLGCVPLDPKELNAKISEFIASNRTS
ncbi:hypothetical protein HYW75_05495 [Candidatus Pacearchaeota archaeon]|nr:hypothetical protein [Candidatus Pacearchaeota archaeon]